jgi:hypothetical protein
MKDNYTNELLELKDEKIYKENLNYCYNLFYKLQLKLLQRAVSQVIMKHNI